MFKNKIKFVSVFLIITFSLMTSLAYPSRVLADDGLPPIDSTPEVIGADLPVTEEAVVLEEITLTNSVVEIVEAMDEAGAVLIDGEGNSISLASEAALELLTVPDPYIVRSGVTYRFLPVGGCAAFPGDPNCTESATPIQTAIDFSVNGETVFVDPGTYVEQLEISKNIVLQATAPGAIIKSPDVLTDFFLSGANKNYPIVYVHDTADASIVGFTIDGDGNGNGNYRFDGIGFFNAGGTIQGNTIQNISDTPFSGTQHGVGIFVYATDGGPHTIIIDGNVIEDYQKNGMTVAGNGVTAEITDNTVTGAGPTTVIAQNGIQVSGGADALIQGNTVTGNVYTLPAASSTGILFFGPDDVEIVDNHLDGNDVNAYITGAGTAEVTGNTILNGIWDGVWIENSGPTTITGNTFSGNAEGVGLWNDMIDMTTVHINGNIFAGNGLGVANYDTVDVDATGNFWGCPAGPDDLACDQVTDYVIYDPWLVENPFVVAPVVGGSNTETRYQATSSDFIIPVTGGELTEISCAAESVTLLLDGQIEVVFTGLCGHEVAFELLTDQSLPGKLDGDGKLLFGLSISIYKDGTSVGELPVNANVTISYPQLGTAMEWNAANGAWQEIQGTEADGQVKVDAGSGTYILLEK